MESWYSRPLLLEWWCESIYFEKAPLVSTALIIPVVRPAQKQSDRIKNNAGDTRETILLRLNAKETKGIVVRRNAADIDNGTMKNGFVIKMPGKLSMSI